MPTTTYNAHWNEATNLTVTDGTGASEKTSGTGGAYDATARIEQRFDGLYAVILKATYGVAGDMAIGVVTSFGAAQTFAVASLVAGWSIEGSNALVKESGTTRATTAVVVTDILEIHLTVSGSTWSLVYKKNGTTVYTSALGSATYAGWRPFRFVATHAGAGSKWSAVTLDAESTELYDPDVSTDAETLETMFTPVEVDGTSESDPLESEIAVWMPAGGAASGGGGGGARAYLG